MLNLQKIHGLFDQLLVSGGNFLTMVLCARALPLSEQGKFSYVFASYTAVLLLNVAGIFQGAAVRAPTQDADCYRAMLVRLQLAQAVLLTTLLVIGWWGAGAWFDWRATSSELLWLSAFLLFQQGADFDRRAAYIFADAERAMLSSAALYPLRIVVLWLLQPTELLQVLQVLFFTALLPAAPTFFALYQDRVVSAWQAVKAHLHYSHLFIIGAPLGWLWSYLPLFLLAMLHGKEQAAVLTSIRSISNMANMLMEQVETKAGADWARLQHQQGTQSLHQVVTRLMRWGGGLWLGILIVIFLFGRGIVGFILGGAYASHWELLLIGWLGYGIYFLSRVVGIKYRTLGVNRAEFMGNLSGVLCALLVGFILIPTNGVVGAAWLYVIIAVAIWAGQTLAVKKALGQ